MNDMSIERIEVLGKEASIAKSAGKSHILVSTAELERLCSLSLLQLNGNRCDSCGGLVVVQSLCMDCFENGVGV